MTWSGTNSELEPSQPSKPPLNSTLTLDARIDLDMSHDNTLGKLDQAALYHLDSRALDSLTRRVHCILRSASIATIAYVRRFPARSAIRSSTSTPDRITRTPNIEYVWLPERGGRRAARPDSANTAWRNTSFRGYADYMDTARSQRLRSSDALAAAGRTALMCRKRCGGAVIDR